MSTLEYTVTGADRAPVPTSYLDEERYLGYREPDAGRPYASFFRSDHTPLSEEVREAMLVRTAT